MNDYNLTPDEFVIMKEASPTLAGARKQRLDEVVLTNLSLILVMSVQEGLFKRTRYVKRLPLATLRRSEAGPQALACKLDGMWWVQASFADDTVSFSLADNAKSTAQRWAEGIRLAASGDVAAIRTASTLPPELADIASGAKDVISSLFAGAAAGTPEAPAAADKPSAFVTQRCIGCHAPLSGKRGSMVTCPYCDTKQTL